MVRCGELAAILKSNCRIFKFPALTQVHKFPSKYNNMGYILSIMEVIVEQYVL